MKARELLTTLLDAGTYRSWDAPPVDVRPDPGYAAELAAARERTGLDESVITGSGLLRGRRVAVVAGEFGFLGGSIGVAAAERVDEIARMLGGLTITEATRRHAAEMLQNARAAGTPPDRERKRAAAGPR